MVASAAMGVGYESASQFSRGYSGRSSQSPARDVGQACWSFVLALQTFDRDAVMGSLRQPKPRGVPCGRRAEQARMALLNCEGVS